MSRCLVGDIKPKALPCGCTYITIVIKFANVCDTLSVSWRLLLIFLPTQLLHAVILFSLPILNSLMCLLSLFRSTLMHVNYR